MADVVGLGKLRAADDNRLWTTEEMLEAFKQEYGSKPAMALSLGTGESGRDFHVAWMVTNLTCSQMLAMLEIAKAQVLNEMGYVQ